MGGDVGDPDHDGVRISQRWYFQSPLAVFPVSALYHDREGPDIQHLRHRCLSYGV